MRKSCFHLVTGAPDPKRGSPGGVPVWPYDTKLNVFCTRRGAPETDYPLDANRGFEPYRPHVKDNAGLAGANSLKLMTTTTTTRFPKKNINYSTAEPNRFC